MRLRRAFLATTVATVFAMPLGARADDDDRVRHVAYEPGIVLPLTLFVGYHVHLEFAADERFVNLGAGDSALVEAAAERNHLFLKPRTPSNGTNLTILTDRRVYYVDYRAFARPPKVGELVYAVVFDYPLPPAPPPVQPPPKKRTPLSRSPSVTPVAQKKTFSPETRSSVPSTRLRS